MTSGRLWSPLVASDCMLWVYAFTAQILLVNLLIAMMTETYTRIKKNASNEYQFQRILIVDEFMGSVFYMPPPFSMPFLMYEPLQGLFQWPACKCSPPRLSPSHRYELLQGLPQWLRYLRELQSDVASFDVTVGEDQNKAAYDEDDVRVALRAALADLLDLHHEDIDVAQKVHEEQEGPNDDHKDDHKDQVHIKVRLSGQGRLSAPADAKHREDEAAKAAHALEQLQLLTARDDGIAVWQQLQKKIDVKLTSVSKLTIDRRSHKQELKPKNPQKAEDLMTFSLPRKDASRLLKSRRDIIMLKELLDEKEAKKQGTMETRLLEKQERMHREMLKTQEVTFTLKKKIEGLMSKVADTIDNQQEKIDAFTTSQPLQIPSDSPSSTGAPPSRVGRRKSQLFRDFAKGDGDGASPSAPPSLNPPPAAKATPPVKPTRLPSSVSTSQKGSTYGSLDARPAELDDDDELDNTGSAKLRQALKEAERRCDELEEEKRERDAKMHMNARSSHLECALTTSPLCI